MVNLVFSAFRRNGFYKCVCCDILRVRWGDRNIFISCRCNWSSYVLFDLEKCIWPSRSSRSHFQFPFIRTTDTYYVFHLQMPHTFLPTLTPYPNTAWSLEDWSLSTSIFLYSFVADLLLKPPKYTFYNMQMTPL